MKNSSIEWKAIPGRDGFRVNSEGIIQSCWNRKSLGRGRGTKVYKTENWRTLTSSPDRNGYLRTVLRKGVHIKNHIAVLLSFVGPRPKGMEARHLDGDRTNSRLNNLVWGTSKENHSDQYRHGTRISGEKHHWSKLDSETVKKIRDEYIPRVVTQKFLANKYGVKQSVISSIINKKHRVTSKKDI